METSRLALAAALTLLASPALAAETASTNADSSAAAAAATADPVPGSAEDAHHAQSDEIIVTGIRKKSSDVIGGISVLDAGDLTRELRVSIGETLARQPGVSATSFGPTASAPVLRGLSGDRVRVLTDGIGSLDVSSSGPDHAISINPITADRIEVLRGPSALMFGSSAIGGVVNVIDTRIPRRVPKNVVGVNVLAGYGSAADERLLNGAFDVPVAGKFVFHVDGNWTKTDDLRTGGFILSKDLREQAAASPDPDIQALADLKGDLPNSASESKEGAIGFAYIDGGLNVGASVTRHTAKYEVPIRYSLVPGIEAEAPTIDQEQTRYDFRAEVPISGFFNQVRARAGYADYHHDELEENGDVGSSFFSKGGEGRFELVQSERQGWGGTSGIQYLDRNARIRGDEKFLPDSDQRQTGLFTLQTLVRGPLRLEGGARIEFSKLTADADVQLGTPDLSRNFTTWSGSLGGKYEFTPGWRAGLTVSRSARAPSIDELFANGPHGGSQSFEIGDPNLDPETSLSVEGSLNGDAGPVNLSANVYYSHFSNFIFQAPTGAVLDDLPVFQTREGAANYYGFEAQASAKLGEALGVRWKGEIQADAVHATVKNYGPAPFIPPFRILGALEGTRGEVDGRLEVEHAFAHTRTAPIETDTPGYTLVNASVDWHVFSANPEFSLSLVANNIFDVVARRSTSMLKDYAPLGGRDIRLTARLGF
ncbi:TonB-dependent receptor [Sphingomonas daechungensis]|uniref:TonB-dependent receptor n=1 Tax=Sphingomonas daechungensis TaxID=1176646 RepID=A0ABX6T0Y8_9SPHN|nr:TonB-dependent receptor [Sphingomonas daechungensis]QNP43186.1 TonB-dependent receptor [Sphingomonas daechungensis]